MREAMPRIVEMLRAEIHRSTGTPFAPASRDGDCSVCRRHQRARELWLLRKVEGRGTKLLCMECMERKFILGDDPIPDQIVPHVNPKTLREDCLASMKVRVY